MGQHPHSQFHIILLLFSASRRRPLDLKYLFTFVVFELQQMLNCILSMVEKTRRALGILQQRANDNQQQQKRRDTSSSSSHHQQQQHQVYEASELRRQAGELIAQTLKATEDRVSQVKRKAGN